MFGWDYSGNNVCGNLTWGDERKTSEAFAIVQLKKGSKNLNEVNCSTNIVMKAAILNLGIPLKNIW